MTRLSAEIYFDEDVRCTDWLEIVVEKRDGTVTLSHHSYGHCDPSELLDLEVNKGVVGLYKCEM